MAPTLFFRVGAFSLTPVRNGTARPEKQQHLLTSSGQSPTLEGSWNQQGRASAQT